MRSLARYIILTLLAISLAGCAPKITYQPTSSFDLPEKATFAVASVVYSPNPLYGSENNVDFDIADRFNKAMNEALSDRDVLSATPDYILNIVIGYYKQGNAGLNFLIGGNMPELLATVSIYNNNSGELVGELQSANNRGRGGIRGWDRIFDIVAEDFVTTLVDSSTRRANTKKQ